MDSWLHLETLILSNARRSSVRFFFNSLRAFLTCFWTITFTSCLVFLFFFLKCFPFFCFACLTSAFSVVHLSMVCQHMPWYWQKFLPLGSSSEFFSSESPRVADFLFLDPFFVFSVCWGNTRWDWFF